MSEAPIPSDPEFRVSGGMKVLVAVFLGPLILFLSGGVVWFVFNGRMSGRDASVLLVAGFGFSAVLASVVWSALRTSVEILPTAMRFTKGLGGEREIPFDRIAGYRSLKGKNGTTLMIVPMDPPQRRILIAQTLGRRKELEDFVKEKFTDLDKADRDADMAAALSDTQLGSTPEERSAALTWATVHTRILNSVVFAAMLWAFIYPRPYPLVIGVLAVIPLVAVALAISSHGAISLYAQSKSVRPSVTYAFLVPALGLALRAFKDWHILGWSAFWLPCAVLGGMMIAILWLGSMSDPHRSMGAVLGLSAVCLAQSFGLVLFVDCYPDNSVPEIHRTRVMSRHITSGKSTNYYVTVGPWLDGTYGRQISVNSSFYSAHSEGSIVLIGVRKGVLQMPWFFVQ